MVQPLIFQGRYLQKHAQNTHDTISLRTPPPDHLLHDHLFLPDRSGRFSQPAEHLGEKNNSTKKKKPYTRERLWVFIHHPPHSHPYWKKTTPRRWGTSCWLDGSPQIAVAKWRCLGPPATYLKRPFFRRCFRCIYTLRANLPPPFRKLAFLNFKLRTSKWEWVYQESIFPWFFPVKQTWAEPGNSTFFQQDQQDFTWNMF